MYVLLLLKSSKTLKASPNDSETLHNGVETGYEKQVSHPGGKYMTCDNSIACCYDYYVEYIS